MRELDQRLTDVDVEPAEHQLDPFHVRIGAGEQPVQVGLLEPDGRDVQMAGEALKQRPRQRGFAALEPADHLLAVPVVGDQLGELVLAESPEYAERHEALADVLRV